MTTINSAVPAVSTAVAALTVHVKPYAEGAAANYQTEARAKITRFVNIACALGKAYVHFSAVSPSSNKAKLTCEVNDVALAIWNAIPEAQRAEKGNTKADLITFESIKQYTTYCNGLIREGSAKYVEEIALKARTGKVTETLAAFDKAGLGNVKAVQNYLYPPKGTNDKNGKAKPAERVATFVKGLDLKPAQIAKAIVKGLPEAVLIALKAEMARIKA